ncbi:MAG: SMC-Scp complex subunit ScpB [Gammaproteobacteria bacterium TMED78]|nr:MAG: SMC-Scp complex subunit ScpB [Gammaproteobacteria bacterium TMED78]
MWYKQKLIHQYTSQYRMDNNFIKNIVESALLTADEPLSLDKISNLFRKQDKPDKGTLKEIINNLEHEYEDRGIEIKEVATGFRIQVKKDIVDWLKPLWEEKPPRYSRALLETLALIAYRQPITRGEIEEVRGVALSSSIIRTLFDRSWIKSIGHKDVPGKPSLLGTTSDFLDYFNLKKLDDLPPLSDIKEINDLDLFLDKIPTPQADLLEDLSND